MASFKPVFSCASLIIATSISRRSSSPATWLLDRDLVELLPRQRQRCGARLSGGYPTKLGVLYAGFPRLAVPSYRDTTEHTFTEEVRWVSTTAGPFNWVLGAFYQDQKQFFSQQDDVLGWSTFATALYGVPDHDEYRFRVRSVDAFSGCRDLRRADLNVTDRLQVTGGVRGFDQQLDISTITKLPICGAFCSNDGTDPEGTTLGSDDTTHRRVLGKFNASYHITPDTMLYATASEGYRRGGANGVPTAGQFAQNAGFVAFGPDTVRNYELGVKGVRYARSNSPPTSFKRIGTSRNSIS